MSTTEETSDVVAGLAAKARRILHVLDAHDGTANTAEIRETTDIPGQLIRYHTETLADRGLVVIVGREDVGNYHPAKVYRLTAAGQSALSEFTTGDGATPAEERADLRRRLDRLEAQLDSLAEGQSSNEEKLERLNDDVADLVDDLSAEFPAGGD